MVQPHTHPTLLCCCPLPGFSFHGLPTHCQQPFSLSLSKSQTQYCFIHNISEFSLKVKYPSLFNVAVIYKCCLISLKRPISIYIHPGGL